MRLRLSIFAAVFLIVGLISISVPEYGYSQENISLGCCISPENGGTCEGCLEGGSGCAIDGSLCPETSDFTLDEVCSVSSVAGAICQAAQSSAGCCINSENTCENDVDFTACSGQHWFEGAACSDVPQCSASKDSLSLMQFLLIALALVIVFSAIREYRKNKARAKNKA